MGKVRILLHAIFLFPLALALRSAATPYDISGAFEPGLGNPHMVGKKPPTWCHWWGIADQTKTGLHCVFY